MTLVVGSLGDAVGTRRSAAKPAQTPLPDEEGATRGGTAGMEWRQTGSPGSTPQTSPSRRAAAGPFLSPSLPLLGLALVLPLAAIVAIGVGALAIPPERTLAALLAWMGLADAAAVPAHELAVVTQVRLPRVLLALGVGAALAVAGAMLQALFRNPLADPGLIGVSSGAALAAVATLVLGGPVVAALGAFALPVGAFCGGLATTLLIYRLGRVEGQVDMAMLLLAGIAVNAIAAAGIGLMVYMSDDQQLRSITFWTMGSLGGAGWSTVLPVLPLLLAPLLVAWRLGRDLDLLSLGEEPARHLGVDVARLKTLAVLCLAVAVGATVAAAGPIGFIGLVVPHLVRLACGPAHALVLPGTALGGALLVLLADTGARTLAAPAELPIGLLTAAIGGPFFLALLLRRRGRDGT